MIVCGGVMSKYEDLTKKIRDWIEKGYEVDELENQLVNYEKMNQEFQYQSKKSNRKIILKISILFFLIIIGSTIIYIYSIGMVENNNVQTPNLQFVKDNVNNKLTVASISPNNVEWKDITIIPSNGIYWSDLNANGFSFNSTDIINTGDYISTEMTKSGSISLRHDSTNTFYGTWAFQ